jgi:hypothetical protein
MPCAAKRFLVSSRSLATLAAPLAPDRRRVDVRQRAAAPCPPPSDASEDSTGCAAARSTRSRAGWPRHETAVAATVRTPHRLAGPGHPRPRTATAAAARDPDAALWRVRAHPQQADARSTRHHPRPRRARARPAARPHRRRRGPPIRQRAGAIPSHRATTRRRARRTIVRKVTMARRYVRPRRSATELTARPRRIPVDRADLAAVKGK